MYMSNRLITLIVDNHKYTLTSECIDLFPESRLTQMLNNSNITEHTHIIKKDDTFYINRDPKVIAFIVDIYRGYSFDIDNIEDLNFKHRVINDLKIFNLYQQVTALDILPDEEMAELLKPETEALDEILKPTDINQMISNLNEQVSIGNNNIFNIVQKLSNDKAFKTLIEQAFHQQQCQDSDTESGDLDDSDSDQPN